jgi:hypothetical protein
VTTEPTPNRKLTPERERELREDLGITATAFEEELAAVLHCSGRTIQRMDLPYWVIAGRRIYDLRGSADRLREIARITASSSDESIDGSLPPAVRHRLRTGRLQREKLAPAMRGPTRPPKLAGGGPG